MKEYRINGREKKSIIVEDKVIKIIKPKGWISNPMEKIIPIESIVGVKVVQPGKLFAGSIRFQTAGNLNCADIIIFDGNKNYEIALEIKEYIKTYAGKISREVKQIFDNTNVISQLEKLAELKDRGVLSEKEFQLQKQKLLNM